MNHAKKLISGLLSVVMLLVMATTAFAQEATPSDASESGNASITISNASKGETYKVYKLFDATVTGKDSGSIAYKGEIPDGLTDYFEADANGYISVKNAAYTDANKTEMSDGLRTALTTWANSATAQAEKESDGTALTFKNLPYGYYVVTTTQGANAITVTSTNPNANIVDKNSSTPSDLKKTATVNGEEVDSVNIGDTVTYTVSFKTSNYDGAGSDAKKILSYTIADTLPDFLENVNVTSIVVDEGNNNTHNVTQQFVDKKITLDWYDEANNQHLYKNGSTVTITYTATVTDKATIDDGGNTNSVTLSWTKDDGKGGTTPGSGGSENTASKTIYTYAIALQKVNEKGDKLAGATFELPFYVKEQADGNTYTYAGTNAGDGLTKKVTTPNDGLIVIKGVKAGTYSIKEVEAPNGYNVLTAPFNVEAVQTGNKATNVTKYVDENGNVTDTKTTEASFEVDVKYDISANVKVVVNKTDTELPSTGGMGTTLFYALGGVLVTGAAILLVVKKRMERSSQ